MFNHHVHDEARSTHTSGLEHLLRFPVLHEPIARNIPAFQGSLETENTFSRSSSFLRRRVIEFVIQSTLFVTTTAPGGDPFQIMGLL